MIVTNHGVNPYSSVQSVNNQLPLQSPAETQSAAASSVAISNQARQMQDAERDIASRYDVTNMTDAQKTAMADELKQQGLIDNEMHLALSFDFSRVAAQQSGLNLDVSATQKHDFVSEFKGELEVARQHGETKRGIELREDMIAVLERMQKLRESA